MVADDKACVESVISEIFCLATELHAVSGLIARQDTNYVQTDRDKTGLAYIIERIASDYDRLHDQLEENIAQLKVRKPSPQKIK